MTRMRAKYEEEVRKALMEKFGYKSPMQIPKLDKIIINIGVGEAKDNAKALEAAVSDLTIITGQKPVITKAKKSVANFKIREGMNLGCKVMNICSKCGKPTRIAYKVLEDGKKSRICKHCQETLD